MDLLKSERLDDAIKQNVLGSLELLEVAKMCPNMMCFVHVSTAYVNSETPGHKAETLPKLNFDCEEFVQLVLQMTPTQIEQQTPKLIGSYPNTYAFSKAITEIVLSRRCQAIGLPLAIVRPSIIAAAVKEPFPGWGDSVSAVSSMILFVGIGIVKYVYGQPHLILDVIPVDIVVNITLACIPRAIAEKKLHIYHVGTSQRNPCRMVEMAPWVITYWNSHNVSRRIGSKTKWTFIKNYTAYKTYYFLQDKLPTTLYSAYAKLFGTVQQKKNAALLQKISERTYQATHLFSHFTTNEFIFTVHNTEALIKSLNEDEAEIFSFDVEFDWERYFRYFTYGVHRFVLKEEVKEPTELLKIDLIQAPRHLSESDSFLSRTFDDLFWAYKSYKPNIGIDNFNTLRTLPETQALILK